MVKKDGATYASEFYVDSLNVTPKSYTGADNNAGGMIKLLPRNTQKYGTIFIKNTSGALKIYNGNKTSNTIEIDSTQSTPTMKADTFAMSAKSLRTISGGLFFGSSISVKITADTSTLVSSVPMTTSKETPTGKDSAYYRRIFIAPTKPADTTGKNGDIWIQYQ